MLWITLIWLWNDANLSIYEHVTHFVPNIKHKGFCTSQHDVVYHYMIYEASSFLWHDDA